MTDEDKLKQVCALTGAGEEADGNLIRTYLDASRELVMTRRHPFSADPVSEAWEARYDGIQCQIAADMFNRRGAEGEVSHAENGITRTWATGGVSRHLLECIVPIARTVRTR